MTLPLPLSLRRLIVLPGIALSSAACALTIGEKAPPLKIAAVVKGKAVDLGKGVHVVEFWATWCVPCKKSIPHLTELAHRYKGKVDFTGVSVWEEGDDQLGQVRRFATAMGDRMGYNVAWDGKAKTMATTWIMAAKQDGIPTAFLVKDGRVLWIGEPMEGLDKAIDQTLAGTFDVAAAKADLDRRMAERARVEALRAERTNLVQPVFQAIEKKDYAAALDAVAKLRSDHLDRPDLRRTFDETEFEVLLTSGSRKMADFANRLATDPLTNPQALSSFAGALLDPRGHVKNRDYAAALTFAKAAADRTGMKDLLILDTYALALHKTDDKNLALEIQAKAVELAKKTPKMNADTIKKLEGHLETLRKG